MSSLWFNDGWWMSMLVNQWLMMVTGMMLNRQQLPWRSFQNARRKAWPWPTPENVALESSSSGTESGWAKQRRLGWFGGQSMGKGPKTWNEGHEHGEKEHNTHGDIFGRLPRQVVRSSQKTAKNVYCPRSRFAFSPSGDDFHIHIRKILNIPAAWLHQPSGLRGIKSPPSKSVMETMWSRHEDMVYFPWFCHKRGMITNPSLCEFQTFWIPSRASAIQPGNWQTLPISSVDRWLISDTTPQIIDNLFPINYQTTIRGYVSPIKPTICRWFSH